MRSKQVEGIFDQLEEGNLNIWDIIDLYENGRDIGELGDVLAQRPHLSSNILYIMREVSSKRITPIWRKATAFLTSSDLNCVFYALDVIHSRVPETDGDEILFLLDKVRTPDKSINEKMDVIRNDILRRRSSFAGTQSQ